MLVEQAAQEEEQGMERHERQRHGHHISKSVTAKGERHAFNALYQTACGRSGRRTDKRKR